MPTVRGAVRLACALVIVASGASALPNLFGPSVVYAGAEGCGGCSQGGCMCTNDGVVEMFKECVGIGGTSCNSCCLDPGQFCSNGNLNNHRDATGGCNVE